MVVSHNLETTLDLEIYVNISANLLAVKLNFVYLTTIFIFFYCADKKTEIGHRLPFTLSSCAKLTSNKYSPPAPCFSFPSQKSGAWKKGLKALESDTVHLAETRLAFYSAQKVKVFNSRFSPISSVSASISHMASLA